VNQALHLLQASGNSSALWLQNCATPGSVRNQGMMLALALSEWYIHQTGTGAARVHGGGFAGTILTVLPNAGVPGYVKMMQEVFGGNAVTALKIRSTGALALSIA
jgi:galactokinase